MILKTMNNLILALLLWIGANSTLSVDDVAIPEIQFVSIDMLHQLAGVRAPITKEKDRVVIALYNRETKIIYLQKSWKGNEIKDQSFLLHELVHYVQKEKGYECNQKKEEEAYELQFKFLREAGIKNPKEVLNIGELFYVILTICDLF